ncbi:MAG: hypothetical protein U0174_07790 [Polyangiaceae bacterium]
MKYLAFACSLGVLFAQAACGSSASATNDAGNPLLDAGGTDAEPTPLDGGADAADAPALPANPAWQTVRDKMEAPFSLTVADGRIYYDDATHGTIESCDEATCKDVKLFATLTNTVRNGTLKTYGKDIVFATGEGVYRADTTTGIVTPIVSRAMTPTALFVHDTVIYFADKMTKTVERVVPDLTPQPTSIVASDVSDVRGIYADATDVFFTIYGSDDLKRGSLVFRASASLPSAGAKTTISGNDVIVAAHDIRVFGAFVYWTGAGGVYRCPKDGCKGPNERAFSEKTAVFEGLGGSLSDTALVSHSSVLRDVSLETPTKQNYQTFVGSMAQSTTTTPTYVYVVSSSTNGDGVIARRKYE